MLAAAARARTPLGVIAPSAVLPVCEALRNADVEVLLDGQGGEPLFMASPVGPADLFRHGRIASAIRAARGFRKHWGYSYPHQLRMAWLAALPRRLLDRAEELRPVPPWIQGPLPPPCPAEPCSWHHLKTEPIWPGRYCR
jgi:hypothetical protein